MIGQTGHSISHSLPIVPAGFGFSNIASPLQGARWFLRKFRTVPAPSPVGASLKNARNSLRFGLKEEFPPPSALVREGTLLIRLHLENRTRFEAGNAFELCQIRRTRPPFAYEVVSKWEDSPEVFVSVWCPIETNRGSPPKRHPFAGKTLWL